MLRVRMLPPLGHKCCISRVGWHGRACRASLMRGELCQIQKAWDMLSVARWPVWLDACWLGPPRLVGSYDDMYRMYIYIHMIWYVMLIEHMTDVFDAYNIWLIWHMRFCNKCLTPRTSNSQWNSWVYRHRLSSNKNTFFLSWRWQRLGLKEFIFSEKAWLIHWKLDSEKGFCFAENCPSVFWNGNDVKKPWFCGWGPEAWDSTIYSDSWFHLLWIWQRVHQICTLWLCFNSWLLKMTHWNSGFSHW